MNTYTNKYLDEIWALHEKYFHTPGMGNYGRGWENQREYYRRLFPPEKRQFEDAILLLCQSKDIEKAKFALTACSELANIFSDDWVNRVISLVDTLVRNGLRPRYRNTISYYVLSLIWEFRIQPLIPFVKEFREKITTNFKQGILARDEWKFLYDQVSRILIRVSPDDFWKEFMTFHQDRELLNLLGSETEAVISIWVSFGAITYGINWLSKLVSEYSNYSDETLKSQALLSIKQSFSIVTSKDPTKKGSRKEFLDWAASQLINR
jgi:hypothetical protein